MASLFTALKVWRVSAMFKAPTQQSFLFFKNRLSKQKFMLEYQKIHGSQVRGFCQQSQPCLHLWKPRASSDSKWNMGNTSLSRWKYCWFMVVLLYQTLNDHQSQENNRHISAREPCDWLITAGHHGASHSCLITRYFSKDKYPKVQCHVGLGLLHNGCFLSTPYTMLMCNDSFCTALSPTHHACNMKALCWVPKCTGLFMSKNWVPFYCEFMSAEHLVHHLVPTPKGLR